VRLESLVKIVTIVREEIIRRISQKIAFFSCKLLEIPEG